MKSNEQLEQLEQLMRESIHRRDKLVAEYKRTHKIPSRGIISTPEIDAERAEHTRLLGEYIKALRQNQNQR